MTINHKWTSLIALVSASLAGLVTLVVGLTLCFMLFWPQHPLTIYGNAVVANPIAASSPDLTYSAKFCKYTDLPATVAVTIRGVNGNQNNVVLPSFTGASPAHCGTAKIPLHLTEQLQPGDYRIYESVSYTYNKLRTVTVDAHSNIFTVVPG